MTVIIGVDPHKSTHTVVAIDRDERPLAGVQLVAEGVRPSGCWPGRNRWARSGPGRSSPLEPPRVSWRLQPLRRMESCRPVDRPGRGRSGSEPCGWCWSIRPSTARSGRRSARSPRSSARHRRRCASGCAALRSTPAPAPAEQPRSSRSSNGFGGRMPSCAERTTF